MKQLYSIRYNVNWLLCTKLINDCVYVSKKFCQNFLLSVCAQEFKYSSILTHTSHLTIDLSHTCAPPHPIKAQHAMTGWS